MTKFEELEQKYNASRVKLEAIKEEHAKLYKEFNEVRKGLTAEKHLNHDDAIIKRLQLLKYNDVVMDRSKKALRLMCKDHYSFRGEDMELFMLSAAIYEDKIKQYKTKRKLLAKRSIYIFNKLVEGSTRKEISIDIGCSESHISGLLKDLRRYVYHCSVTAIQKIRDNS